MPRSVMLDVVAGGGAGEQFSEQVMVDAARVLQPPSVVAVVASVIVALKPLKVVPAGMVRSIWLLASLAMPPVAERVKSTR